MLRNRRPGFTLVELMAALALSGIILLGAQALLGSLESTRASFAHRSVRHHESGTGFRRLREALMMAEAVESGADPFFGDASGAVFSSRCRSGGGWYERCHISIELVERDGVTQVRISEGFGRWTIGQRYDGAARMIYLGADSDDGAWRERWGTSIARPVAVGLVVGSDTTVLAGALR